MFLSREDQVEQDWPRIAEYLARHNMHLALDEYPRQFSSGAANMNFMIILDGKKAVLRRPPEGVLPPGANDVAREYEVLSRLWRSYPLAPRALHFCGEESIIGVQFCISEFCEGEAIKSELPALLQDVPQVGRKLCQLTIEALASLHQVDPVSVGLENLGDSSGFVIRQIKGWHKRACMVLEGKDVQLHEEIGQWLQASLPEQQPSSIVHNDFKLDNMLVDLERLEVNAVVDWDMCTLGNPLYELAILLLYWGEQGDPPAYDSLTRMPWQAEGWMTRREAIALYLEKVPFTLTEEDLRFYIVLALYRSAVVLAQLCKLYSDGTMKSTAFTKESVKETESAISEILVHAESLQVEPLPW